MATKLFVAKLSFDTTNDNLQALFAQYGTVESVNIIMDRDSGKSKGFGFVEMASDDEAQAAIKAVDGLEFEGRTLAVSVARPRESRPQGDYERRNDNFRSGFRNN